MTFSCCPGPLGVGRAAHLLLPGNAVTVCGSGLSFPLILRWGLAFYTMGGDGRVALCPLNLGDLIGDVEPISRAVILVRGVVLLFL